VAFWLVIHFEKSGTGLNIKEACKNGAFLFTQMCAPLALQSKRGIEYTLDVIYRLQREVTALCAYKEISINTLFTLTLTL
jgi:hypothetical protein